MSRRMLYYFGSLLSLSFICQLITDVRQIEATHFDELSDEQKGAAMELLKQAMSETNVDPLELIRKGMEKVKEDQEKLVMSDQPRSVIQPEEDTASKLSSTDALDVTPTNPIEASETSSTVKTATEDNRKDPIQESSSESKPVYETTPVVMTTSTSSTTDTPAPTVSIPTEPLEPTLVIGDNSAIDQGGNQRNFPVDQGTNQTPANDDYENLFIDESDPNDPKRVHVKNRTKSKYDENGFSHEHQESVSSTSIGSNPNVFSKHSSSFSSSGSSNAFVNGKQVKPMAWTYNNMKPFNPIPPLAKIPNMPPMPTMPPMPIMPFGPIIAGPWSGYFGQNYEDLGYPVQSSAYASAYAGLPENFFGIPSAAPMSKRKARKLARKQERAARRALEHEYYN